MFKMDPAMHLEEMVETRHRKRAFEAPFPDPVAGEYFTDALLTGPDRDPFFQALAALDVHLNYFQRTKASQRQPQAEEGHERHSLFKTSLFVDCPGIEGELVKNYRRRRAPIELTQPMSVADLLRKIIDDGEGDGVYVASSALDSYDKPTGNYRVTEDKVFLYNPDDEVIDIMQERYASEGIDIAGFEDVKRLCLPPDFVHFRDRELPVRKGKIGSRTQLAMNAPVYLDGGRVFLIRQTVYDDCAIGKTAMFDRNGLAAEFFLAREEGLSSALKRKITAGSYIDRDEGVVGVLRTYHPRNKRERREYIIPPPALQLRGIPFPTH